MQKTFGLSSPAEASEIRLSPLTSLTMWFTEVGIVVVLTRHRCRPLMFRRTQRERCAIFAVILEESSHLD